MLQGQFDKSVKVMVGHNSDEGLLFANPFLENQTAGFEGYIKSILPTISPKALDLLQNNFYPETFSGPANYTYRDAIQRIGFAIAEGAINCNTNYLDRAYGNKTVYVTFRSIRTR